MGREKTKRIYVGGVSVGGGAPVSIQSMCTTKTADVKSTLSQIERLSLCGCDIVRVSVADGDDARAVRTLCAKSPLPIIADIHFDHRLAIACAESGVSKIRINPGNIGGDEKVRAVAAACAARGIPIRIGVNAGSLDKKLLEKHGGPTAAALVESAAEHVEKLERVGFSDICISLKASNVVTTIEAYRLAAAAFPYPLHLGVTEAGGSYAGTIKSAVGIGALLCDGIGDTIRVSLTAPPEDEVRAAKEILKAAGLRRFGAELISCPTCGRTRLDIFSLAAEVERAIESIDAPITVAVMGCVVNGPGEAREADFGIAGGDGEGVLFKKGKAVKRVLEQDLVSELLEMIKGDIG